MESEFCNENLTESEKEAFAERAASMHFDGGLSRRKAEIAAMKLLIKENGKQMNSNKLQALKDKVNSLPPNERKKAISRVTRLVNARRSLVAAILDKPLEPADG